MLVRNRPAWQVRQAARDEEAMALIERTEEQEAVGDDGHRRIRSDIVFGRLRPGEKLRLERLKEDYGVSDSTLREILNRLAAEGFVLAEGRRGFEVAPISVENLRELAEPRLRAACDAGVVRQCRCRVGRARRLRPSQAGVNRAADGNRPRRAPAVEAL